MSAIVSAVFTEKSVAAAAKGQYSFIISPRATKNSIASEINKIFNVDVITVRTITIPGKVKQRGKIVGQRSDVRKAIVTLKKGQKINEFTLEEKK